MSAPNKRYVVGVDGGGTKCRAAVADITGAVLGEAVGISANIATDFDNTRRNVMDAVLAAYDAAGLSHTQLASDVAWLGLAGANIGDFSHRMEHVLPFRRVRVVSDREISLKAALGDADGCVAAIGTGSAFIGQHGGKVTLAGGWGFQLGDDASGAHLGREALRRTILCHDGLMAHSRLTQEILKEFGGTPAGIVEFALRAGPADYGAFAPRLIAGARTGDAIASQILDTARRFVQSALDQVGLTDDDPLCLLGGLGPVYLEFLDARYKSRHRPAKSEPLRAAIAMARSEFAETLGSRA